MAVHRPFRTVVYGTAILKTVRTLDGTGRWLVSEEAG